MEAAFEALDHQDFHELGEVALTLLLLLFDFAFEVSQRLVARICKFLRQEENGFVEDFVFSFAELVEERFRVGYIWKFEALGV